MTKTMIIAELSGNHNQDLQYTKDSMYAIKETGADAVKLQTYTADALTLNVDNDEFGPRQSGLWQGQTPYDVFTRGALPYAWHAELFAYAKSLDLLCFSTPFDQAGLMLLESVDNPIYKVASFEIKHVPLLEQLAATGKPIIISTGIATLADIEQALGYFPNKSNITLLKCTSAYPAPYDQIDLKSMVSLQHMFGVKVGVSDHTLGAVVPIAAVALGASMIEKHFILDRTAGGIDVDFSMDAYEFTDMVKQVRITEQVLGERRYQLSPSALSARQRGRKIYIKENVKSGDTVTPDNIAIVRGQYGLEPLHYQAVLGQEFKTRAHAGDGLEWHMLNDERCI